MTPSRKAAEQVFDFVYPGRYDETGNVTARYERIITEAYAERDAAVAELVAMASRAANELLARDVKCQGLVDALARLEGERE